MTAYIAVAAFVLTLAAVVSFGSVIEPRLSRVWSLLGVGDEG